MDIDNFIITKQLFRNILLLIWKHFIIVFYDGSTPQIRWQEIEVIEELIWRICLYLYLLYSL